VATSSHSVDFSHAPGLTCRVASRRKGVPQFFCIVSSASQPCAGSSKHLSYGMHGFGDGLTGGGDASGDGFGSQSPPSLW